MDPLLIRETEEMERVAAEMEAEIEQLKREQVPESGVTPQLEKLQSENAKLKYQRAHLIRSIDTEESRCEGRAVSLSQELKKAFKAAIARAYPQLDTPTVSLTPSTKEKFGDYQCNAAMALNKALKAQGVKASPMDVAKTIIDNLSSSSLIGKIEVAPPGFINIHLSPGFVKIELTKLLTEGVKPPRVGARKRVVVDMSSPNIAKEMHVGHLRSTIIGDSIATLCQFVGHDVLKINHVGDWGTQFGMLIAHLVDQFPNYRQVAPPIADLQAFYKESKKRFDDDAAFKERAYSYVVRLQSREPDVTQAWNLICDVSRKEFDKIYSRLNIKDLIERGESFYQDLMTKTVANLKSRGVLQEDEGRLIMFPEGCNIPLTMVKSDGGFTYDTSDMAALQQRLQEEQGQWLLYVVDNGQGEHFNSVFRAAESCGMIDKQKHRVQHVGFGVVLGTDGKKFKTRSGETVRLVDLLDEGLQRSEAKLVERGRDKELSAEEFGAARDAVAYGCIKYADLAHNRSNDYIFSFDRMLDDSGNTAVYLLYAYTRIRSIARNAQVTREQLAEAAKSTPVALTEPAELKLGKFVLRFPDVILRMLDDLYVHSLCEFMYELCKVFTEFYDCCYCVEKDDKTGEKRVNMSRLLLVEAVGNVMQQCFTILGLQPVNRM